MTTGVVQCIYTFLPFVSLLCQCAAERACLGVPSAFSVLQHSRRTTFAPAQREFLTFYGASWWHIWTERIVSHMTRGKSHMIRKQSHMMRKQSHMIRQVLMELIRTRA